MCEIELITGEGVMVVGSDWNKENCEFDFHFFFLSMIYTVFNWNIPFIELWDLWLFTYLLFALFFPVSIGAAEILMSGQLTNWHIHIILNNIEITR